MTTTQQATDYRRVERAIGFLVNHADAQPKLSEVAGAIGLSTHRTQRLFKRWAGVSPKRFLEFLTVQHAKHLLEQSSNVLDASLEVGLSGPGRLHDHFVKLEAMTPGEYKADGSGLTLRYGVHSSPFGEVFLAASGRGVHRLSFVEDGDCRDLVEGLKRSWPAADLARDQAATGSLANEIFDPGAEQRELLVRVSGTNFQLAVWRALLEVPRGRVTSYEEIATAAGSAGATRATGSAIGANPVAFLIPCHRVIRKSGVVGKYRWGSARKRALLAWEAAQVERLSAL